MDKWFMLQATMHRQPGDAPVLERVRGLMSHPSFSMRNPNKVRALITAFCGGNLAEFHAPDGSGYAFWAEQARRQPRKGGDGQPACVERRVRRHVRRRRKRVGAARLHRGVQRELRDARAGVAERERPR